MGLLDQLNGMSPEQSQGLLAAAAQMLQQSGPSRMPTSFGQILGGGLSAFQGGSDAARKRKLEEEQAKQMEQLRGLQIQEAQGGLQDHAQSRADAERLRQFYINRQLPTGQSQLGGEQQQPQQALPQPLGAVPQQSTPGMSGTLPQAPQQAAQGQPSPYEQRMAEAQALKEAGFHTQAAAAEQAALKFKPEFDQTPRTGVDRNNKPIVYVMDKDGNKKILDVLPRDEMKLANLGGKQVAYNPFSLTPNQSFTNTLNPGEAASNSLGRDRLAFDKDQIGKPTFNADAGGFITRPNAKNPNGSITPLEGFNKPLTESQGKASLFASRMDKADKIMGSLSADGTLNTSMIKGGLESLPLVGGALSTAGNFAASSNQQRLEQAQRDFVNAVLRQESGASISPSEFDSAKKQYFPQRGDSPETIAQKAANRRTAIEGMSLESGGGAAKLGAGGTKPGQWSITKVN